MSRNRECILGVLDTFISDTYLIPCIYDTHCFLRSISLMPLILPCIAGDDQTIPRMIAIMARVHCRCAGYLLEYMSDKSLPLHLYRGPWRRSSVSPDHCCNGKRALWVCWIHESTCCSHFFSPVFHREWLWRRSTVSQNSSCNGNRASWGSWEHLWNSLWMGRRKCALEHATYCWRSSSRCGLLWRRK